MHELDAKLPNEERPFGHVALIAADVDLAEFVKWLPAVHRKSVSVSMYFNPDDLALKASRLVHVAKRAGELPLLVGELENIDAQKANTSGLGHGYFAAEDELLIDLQLLINHNLRPPGRPTVRERRTADRFTYWFFP